MAFRTQDNLHGEVAVVTGASRGLGLLLARELARQGCALIICARDPAELGRAAVQLREDGADVASVACDWSRRPSTVTAGSTSSSATPGSSRSARSRRLPLSTSSPRWTSWRLPLPGWPWRRCR
jgi:hypothetical protein